jgi:hypothetical protein
LKSITAVAGILLLCVPAIASAQANADYVIIGDSQKDEETRWIFTWWDARGLFHGVDSVDLVPLVYRDRAERTRAADAISLGLRVDEKKAKAPSQQRLRPNLPPTDAQAKDGKTKDGKTKDGRDQRRRTQTEIDQERSQRLTLLRSQLRKVEEQLAAFEEGTITKAAQDDADLSDSQLDARLTHLETRLDYLTGEIKALEAGS